MVERARSRRGARWTERTNRHHRTETAHRVPVRVATVSIDARSSCQCHEARPHFQIPAYPPVLEANLVDASLPHKPEMVDIAGGRDERGKPGHPAIDDQGPGAAGLAPRISARRA